MTWSELAVLIFAAIGFCSVFLSVSLLLACLFNPRPPADPYDPWSQP